MDPRLRRYLLRQITFVAFAVALMFLLAGRLDWRGGWLVTAIQVGSLAGQWLIVGRRHPDLLLERSGLGEGVERGDIPLALGMAYGPFVAMLIAGLEVGLPAVLGSWWSVPIMALLIAITVVRTAREDRYLCAHLAGYVGYADQVRWRLVPRIW
jgi:hypothetical protein